MSNYYEIRNRQIEHHPACVEHVVQQSISGISLETPLPAARPTGTFVKVATPQYHQQPFVKVSETPLFGGSVRRVSSVRLLQEVINACGNFPKQVWT